MKVLEEITSLQNPKIKNIVKLQQKSSERKAQGLFVVEGTKEIERAFRSGFRPKTIFFCSSIMGILDFQFYFELFKTVESHKVTKEVYSKISYREDSGGIVVLFELRTNALSDLKLSHTPLVLVLDAVEKPGNIGAMLRTADAVGVDSVLLTGTTTDIFNPNAIRASVGCVFTVPVAECSIDEAVEFLVNRKISIYCTHLEASKNYAEIDFRTPAAIVMGTEATGIADKWLTVSTSNIIIPMRGIADSMNVSVSAAVILYEAARQRGFHKNLTSK